MAEKGQDPRHPKSSYEAKYPFNQVVVTEAGHEFQYDNTPGKERIREAHKSGTYYEISPDGKHTELVVAHKISYVKGGETKTVDKNSDVKVGGSTRSSVSGDSHSEVKGTKSSAVSGDVRSVVGGDSIQAIKGDEVKGVAGGSHCSIAGGSNTKIDGDVHTISDGKGTHEYAKEYTLKSKKDILIESETKITLKVGQCTIEMTPTKIVLTNKQGKIITVGNTWIGLENEEQATEARPKVVLESGPAKKARGLEE